LRVAIEPLGGLQQGRETATKTPPGYLLGCKSTRTQQVRIDESLTLIVRDQTHAKPLLGKILSRLEHAGRLARTEKAADHDVLEL
jgi:hypothetical protein